MKSVTVLSSALLVAAGSLLIAQQVQEQERPARPQIQPVPGEVEVGSEFDEEFLKEAYRNNKFEIKASETVLDKTDREDVRRFAQMMIAEHTQANQRIEQAAEQLDVELPDELADWQQAKLEAMEDKPSDQLGVKYMFHQVGGHVQAVYTYRFAANRAREPQVRQLAQNMIPELEQHLQHANRIAEQLAGPPGLRIMGTPAGPRPDDRSQQD